MARVLLGVTGGIAAYKACELCRLLVKAGHEVTPILTPDAERFVTAHTFEALARREAPRDLYPHLVDADLLVIAPLSANTLAKLAHGLADNVLTQLGARVPRASARCPGDERPHVGAPRDPGERGRSHRARDASSSGLQRVSSPRASIGPGRMTEPEEIFARCQELLGQTGPLAGKRVVVSAGGTREPLDLVRFIGNRSSGRMGVAVAAEAKRRGADVTLVYANGRRTGARGSGGRAGADGGRPGAGDRSPARMPTSSSWPPPSPTTRPSNPESGKRPKDKEPWTITLEPTDDVLAELGRTKQNGQILVGFAAEGGADGLERARGKLANKHGNLFVYNDVSQPGIGFESEDNEIVLLSARGERKIGRRSKEECAVAILDEVEALLGGA